MQTWLLIGLGNPGKRYEYTRHNLGFLIVKAWFAYHAADTGQSSRWQENSTLEAEVTSLHLTPDTVVEGLLPTTFMNESGRAVSHYLQRTSIPPERILIVHDDIELPWGAVRLKAAGSARGHNGVRSIHAALGTTELPRLLVGVERPPADVSVDAYVLQPFTEDEKKRALHIVTSASQAITEYLTTVPPS